MKELETVVLAIIMIVLLGFVISLLTYTIYLKIRCWISDYRYNVQLTIWRKQLNSGEEIMVEEHNTQKRTIVAINGDIIQVKNQDGNLSGHHISTIYPISRNHGQTK
jgi:hypothetical protein